MLLHTLMYLEGSLVYMHMDLYVHFFSESRYFLQWCIGNRIRCMRTEDCADKRAIFEFVMDLFALQEIFIRVPGPGRWKIDHDKTDIGPDTALHCSFRNLVREKIHIIKTGGAATDHLGDGMPCPVFNKFGIDPALFCRPDMIVQPVHERQIICESTELRHGRVRVAIDESGDQRMGFQINFFISSVFQSGFFSWQYIGDFAIVNRQGMMFINGVIRVNRYDPAGVDESINIHCY